MDDLNAEKRDFREKDEVDEYLNKEREEVEKDEQEEEEIQGGEINLRKFKAGGMQDAVEYPAWTSRDVFGSKVLPTDPCMMGDAQPDLIKILLLQMGVNLYSLVKQFHRNFYGKIDKQHGNTSRRTRNSGLIWIPKFPIPLKTMMATSLNPLTNKSLSPSWKSQ